MVGEAKRGEDEWVRVAQKHNLGEANTCPFLSAIRPGNFKMLSHLNELDWCGLLVPE